MFNVCNFFDFFLLLIWIVFVEFVGVVLCDYVLGICDGQIVLVVLCEQVMCYGVMEICELFGMLFVFGLVNVYGYLVMSLFCGFVDDLLLMIWLQDYIWLVEG